jgi:hypothetical protein
MSRDMEQDTPFRECQKGALLFADATYVNICMCVHTLSVCLSVCLSCVCVCVCVCVCMCVCVCVHVFDCSVCVSCV